MESLMNGENLCSFVQAEPHFENSSRNNNGIEECLSHLLQGLSALGFTISKYAATFTRENDSHVLTSVIQRVLCIISESKKAREQLEEGNQKLSADLKHAYAVESRNQSILQQSERQVLALKEKERQLLIKLKNIQIELKTEKDEAKRLRAILLQKKVQYQHEIRRKEQELVQVSEQLHRSLNERRQHRPEIKILNVLSRQDGTRGKWNTEVSIQKQENEFLKKISQDCKTRYEDLMKENESIKEVLASFLQQVEFLVRERRDHTEGIEDNASTASSWQSSIGFSDGDSGFSALSREPCYFQIHFNKIRPHIEEIFQEKLKIIKESGETDKGRNVNDETDNLCTLLEEQLSELKKDSIRLKEELAEKMRVIEEQDKLLHAATTVGETENPYLRDGFVLEERERFRKEREQFLEQRSNFERERKSFTEAAIRLAKEKREFEERRLSIFALHDISCETPPTQRHKSARHNLPSTPELYHILGLSNAD